MRTLEPSARARSIKKKLTFRRFYKQPAWQMQSRRAQCLRTRGHGRHGDDDPNERRSRIRKDARSEFFSNRSALEPLARSLWNDQAQVIKEIARSKTQQVQKQVTKPEPQFVQRIEEMRLRTSEVGLGRSSNRFQEWRFNSWRSMWACTESDTCQPAAVEQVQLRCELVKRSCLSNSIQYEKS